MAVVSWVEGKGMTLAQLRAQIERAERAGQKELASMLKTILEIREKAEAR